MERASASPSAISTKLNRSHLVHGEVSYILPCLGRTEIDRQATGRQAIQRRTAPAFFMLLADFRNPRASHACPRAKIVAEIAKATLTPNPKVDWDGWIADYDRIRESIEATYPEDFADFNRRMWQPEGFQRKIPRVSANGRPVRARRISSAPKA